VSAGAEQRLVHPAAGELEPPAGGGPAARVAELKDARVTLFSNNKPNVDVLYDELARLIAWGGGAADLHRVTKLSSAFPAADEDIEQATTGRQLVVNGMGD
jgi:hypothetical protein